MELFTFLKSFLQIVLWSLLLGYFIFIGPTIIHDDDIIFSPGSLAIKYPPKDFDDLDKYILHKNNNESNMIWDSGATISYYNNTKKQTEYCALFIHGLGGTHKDFGSRILSAIQTEKKCNYYCPRFPGHGTVNPESSNFNLYDMLHETYEAVCIAKYLGSKIIFVGISTGCLYILWAISRFRLGKLASHMIFISPNFGVKFLPQFISNKVAFWPITYRILRKLNDKVNIYNKVYNKSFIFTMFGILSVCSETLKRSLVDTPLQIISSISDPLVDHKRNLDFYNDIDSIYKHMVECDIPIHPLSNSSVEVDNKIVFAILDFFNNPINKIYDL